MSLLTSVTQDSRGVPSFIEAAYTSGGAAMIATASAEGIARIQSSTGNVTRLRGAAPATTLSLGLDGASSPANANAIVVTSAPDLTTIATNTVCAGGLTVAGNSLFTSSIDLNNQQLQNNLRYTQAFGPIPDGTNNGALGTPQPALIAGSYAIYVQVTGAPEVQPSAIGYWNGAQWSAGGSGTAVSYPGGSAVLNIRPDPATSGAALCISNATGGAVSGFVYYASLGEN